MTPPPTLTAIFKWWQVTALAMLQSQVKSNQTHKYTAQTIGLAYNGHAEKCIHTGRVKSSRVPQLLPYRES